ncbi:MAG: TerC/Alx family metal homeostasis membrane protein [Gaiellaceae bacterium]
MSVWIWSGFCVLVALLFAFDLTVFNRGGGEISLRRAAWWSIGWSALGVLLALPLFFLTDGTTVQEYLTGFLIEKSLSTDNLFVFALILGYFSVPKQDQRRVLFWGIVGALFLRAIFIFAGAALLDAFRATIYVFGAFLIITGIRMWLQDDVQIDPEKNPLLRIVRRIVPMSTRFHGDKLLARENGKRLGTPLLAALVLVAAFDVAFAIDSIPAIFAITRNTFVVFAANAMSLLGLSSLYFVLLGLIARFTYLDDGLAAVLVLIGVKMALSEVVHIPVFLSLLLVLAVLTIAIVASLLRGKPEAAVDDADRAADRADR